MISQLDIANYRCFENLSLSFGEGVNLLIGDNASGKTTVIKALGAVLNSFFSGFSDENTRYIGLEKEDFREQISNGVLLPNLPISLTFSFLNTEASLQLHSHKGRTLQSPLKPIKELGKDFYTTLFDQGRQRRALPLFAGFFMSDIHASRKLNESRLKQYLHRPSFGYYECLQGDGFLGYWTTRMLVLREANEGEQELGGVIEAIRRGLGEDGCGIIADVEVRPQKGQVYYRTCDGRMMATHHLSDGMKRLANIFMDIAFRCMLLNQAFYGPEACLETKGTVIIDEADLHLHPTLQAKLVKGLQAGFPKLQFILSAHAPMIMTGVRTDERNKIYRLSFLQEENRYQAQEISLYGLDASTIIQAALGVVPRDAGVDERLAALFSLIDAEEYEQAQRALAVMRQEFGNQLPELSRAESMLNFLMEELDD
jgi:predicted ATPase